MIPLSSSTLHRLHPGVAVPRYDRDEVTVGIVHLGPGAFHRAHQAMYVDAHLAEGDPSWGICTVGLRPEDTAVRDVLAAQDGLYTLLTVTPQGSEEVRVIGSLARHLQAPDRPGAVLDVLTSPATRVVTLTITEGGYGVDKATGAFEPPDDLTRADLRGAGPPTSAFGYLTAALAARRDAGIAPFTVVSCDNVQGNGEVTAAAVTGFAARRDPDLSAWIRDHVAFPSTMVDRITPRTDDAVRAAVQRHGVDDRWPVRAEAYAQWVCEDVFPTGRPELERVGVQFVADVAPYEKLKLRMLNASHQAMSHLGLLCGFQFVHEVCRDPSFVAFLRGYLLEEAAPTLAPVPGIEVSAYADVLLERFASTAVQDTLARQVVDASDRIATFLLPVVVDLLAQGRSFRRSALVLAAWCRYLDGETMVAPVDRRLAELTEAVGRERSVAGAFLSCKPVFGDLGDDPQLRAAFFEAGDVLRRRGPRAAMAWASGS